MKQTIYLYIQLPDQTDFVTLGRLTVENGVGQFVYGPSYPTTWVLDEIHYPWRKEPYTITTNNGIPNFVMDIMPDAWGKVILKRIYAREKDTPWSDLDFLIKAKNADRFGNLCVGEIKTVTQKATLENFQHLVKLSDFLDFSVAMRKGEAITRIQLAMAQTTSLGGARPKITLVDQDKLYLAKPKDRDDLINVPQVEFSCLSFAEKKGLAVAKHQLIQVSQQSEQKDVLLLERFDRIYDLQSQKFKRLPMLSGLTLLDAEWNSTNHERWSYPLMANEMYRKGMLKQDIHELFRRMIFNILIGNDDDHPKNHAFMYLNGRWRIAPLFDIVPNQEYKPQGLSMQIGIYGTQMGRENVLSMANQFLLSPDQAQMILDEMIGWEAELIQYYRSQLTPHDAEIVISAMGVSYLKP